MLNDSDKDFIDDDVEEPNMFDSEHSMESDTYSKLKKTIKKKKAKKSTKMSSKPSNYVKYFFLNFRTNIYWRH